MIPAGLTAPHRWKEKPDSSRLRHNPAWNWFWQSCLFGWHFPHLNETYGRAGPLNGAQPASFSRYGHRVGNSLFAPTWETTDWGPAVRTTGNIQGPFNFLGAVQFAANPGTWPVFTEWTIFMLVRADMLESDTTKQKIFHLATSTDAEGVILIEVAGNTGGSWDVFVTVGDPLVASTTQWSGFLKPNLALIGTQLVRLAVTYTVIAGNGNIGVWSEDLWCGSTDTAGGVFGDPVPTWGGAADGNTGTIGGAFDLKAATKLDGVVAFFSMHNESFGLNNSTLPRSRVNRQHIFNWMDDPYGMLWRNPVTVEGPFVPGPIVDGVFDGRLRTPRPLEGMVAAQRILAGQAGTQEALQGDVWVRDALSGDLDAKRPLGGNLTVKHKESN